MIEDADRLGDTPEKETALACVEAGIDAAHPRSVVRGSIGLDGDTLRIADAAYSLAAHDELLLVGGGKATGAVAAELDSILGDRLDGGVVVTTEPVESDRIEMIEGDHPVPSERGVEGARRVLELAESAGESTLVLAVITGGGSALLPAPAEGISLSDLQSVTNALLDSGADIHEINAVRKHLSAIKGGQLARAAAPATVVTLILSDVVGNDLDVIASGPTAPDASTFADAREVLERYSIDPPAAIGDRLDRGARSEIPETPRPDDPIFDRVTHHVLADGFTALVGAQNAAVERGYETMILSSRVRGEAREAAKTHVAIAEESVATGAPLEPPAVVLSGGETTVTVRGEGRGGPNLEFATSAALELGEDTADTVLACVDTDGIDGAADAAGALVGPKTVDDPGPARSALAENDVYPYLAERDALLVTGGTGTNVNDLRVLVIR